MIKFVVDKEIHAEFDFLIFYDEKNNIFDIPKFFDSSEEFLSEDFKIIIPQDKKIDENYFFKIFNFNSYPKIERDEYQIFLKVKEKIYPFFDFSTKEELENNIVDFFIDIMERANELRIKYLKNELLNTFLIETYSGKKVFFVKITINKQTENEYYCSLIIEPFEEKSKNFSFKEIIFKNKTFFKFSTRNDKKIYLIPKKIVFNDLNDVKKWIFNILNILNLISNLEEYQEENIDKQFLKTLDT